MTPKRRRFVIEYLKDQNGTQAAIRSGYSKHSARAIATDLLAIAAIRNEIDEHLSKIESAAVVDSFFVLKGLREVAMRCMQTEKVLNSQGDETGEYKFDSSGANRAFELLGKHLKLFTDKVEHDVSKSLEAILGETHT